MDIKVILFDLGGVLIELDTFPVKPDWLGHLSQADVYRQWLEFPVARQYECGQISEKEFSTRVINEIPLNTSSDEFIKRFRAWPLRLYPGVLPMLSKLAEKHTIACLSNTNVSHWSGVMD